MAAPAQLGVYFAVLRKHLLLMAVSAAIVIAAGVFYVVRQQPVFLSTATLLIETPTRNVAGGGEYADLLAQNQDELLTQVTLLKQNAGLAQKAVDRLKADGVDVVKGDYSAATLPARVKVDQIPGTSLVSFSLTGPDRATLARAVNAYALVFQEWSEDKSAKRVELVVDAFAASVVEAEKKLKEAQDARTKLVTDHKELNLPAGENGPADALRALQTTLATLETRHEEDAADWQAIQSALEQAGVEARKRGEVYVLAAKADGAALAQLLTDDTHVVNLKCAQSNDVQQTWIVERDANERDRRAAEQGIKETSGDRRTAIEAARRARTRRGLVIQGAVEMELNAITARERSFQSLTAKAEELRTSAAAVAGLLVEHQNLKDAVDAAMREWDTRSAKLKSLQTALLHDDTAEGSTRRGTATRRIVMATAAAGADQIAPKVPLIIGLTAFAAIAVGLGLVLLFEYLDDTVKSKEDFDRYVGLPFLGFIPRIEGKDAQQPDTAADAKTGSAIAEAFRAVRTSILFSRSDKPVRSILVTSAGPGEGKTTVATNLAITLAKHKAPVLLVDADLRRPRVAKALGVDNKIGLTNYLIGEATLDQVVQKTSVEGLFVITSGPIPPNPAELLHGEQLSALIKNGLERFDRIVIDSPPVIAVSDARVIARATDGLYLVISMGKTSWRLIQRSVESLTSIGFEVHGAILNNLSAPTGRYGYYYYRDYNYGKSYYIQPPPAAEA